MKMGLEEAILGSSTGRAYARGWRTPSRPNHGLTSRGHAQSAGSVAIDGAFAADMMPRQVALARVGEMATESAKLNDRSQSRLVTIIKRKTLSELDLG